MKCTVTAFIIIPCLAFLSGCAKDEIPSTEVSEVPGISAAVDDSDVYAPLNEPPKLIKIVMPQYPEEARKDRIEGKVVVSLNLDEEGNVVEADVVTSEPTSIFDEAALAAVRKYKFEPTTKDGEAIKVKIEQTIIFALAPKN